jgi:hypothetical protein
MAEITPPLENTNTLPVQIAVIVPSTREEKKISKGWFKRRIRETRKWMDRRFGGDTTVRGSGGYTDDGRVITEEVRIVESSTTVQEYKQYRKEFGEFVRKKQDAWDQLQLAYIIEGRTYLYPQKDYADHDEDVRNKLTVV